MINIEISKIKEPDIRSRKKIEEYETKELAESIKEVGLINPIQVKKVDNGYEVVAGERRYLACKMLNWVEIQAVVVEDKNGKADGIKLAENIARLDLNPIELAKTVFKIKIKYNLTSEVIARSIGKTKRWLNQKLELLKLPIEIQDAIEKRLITERVGLKLGEVDEKPERDRLLMYASLHGVTWPVICDWVRSYFLNKDAKKKAIEKGIGEGGIRDEKEIMDKCLLCGEKDNILKLKYVAVHPECEAELNYRLNLERQKEVKGV